MNEDRLETLWNKVFVGNHEPAVLVRVSKLESDMSLVVDLQEKQSTQLQTLIDLQNKRVGAEEERVIQDKKRYRTFNIGIAVLGILLSWLAYRVETKKVVLESTQNVTAPTR